MKFTLSSSKLTAAPGPSGWSQVHEFKPEDKEKLKLRGHLYAVVSTGRHEEGVDSVVAGRELLARLHEEYFGNLEPTAYNALKAAVEKVISEFESTWGDVEIAAVSVVGDVVYSAAGGGAQISIFRNGMLANILASTKGAVASASGCPKEDDLLILGTKPFFEEIPSGVTKAALESLDPKSAVETLAPMVHSKEDTGNLGAVILRFGLEEEPIQAGIVEPEGISTSGKPPRPKISPREILTKGVGRISSLVGRKLPERRIYVRETPDEMGLQHSRKVTLTIGAILLVLLVVSIGFGIRQRVISETRARYETRLNQAIEDFEEAVSLASLDPVRARELFVSSQTLAMELTEEGVKDAQLEELKGRLETAAGAILGEYKPEAELFLDLAPLSDNFRGDEMAVSNERIFILDKNGRRIAGVLIGTKRTEMVAGPDQVGQAEAIAAYETRAFVLGSEGIYEVGRERVRVIDKTWEGEVMIHAYAGNLYLLDTIASTIWRYPGSGDTFGTRQNWLSATARADFRGLTAWSIDGSVWILTKPFRISNFMRGNPQSFTVTGVFPELTSADDIYTNDELESLYVLDREGSRVVVLNKNGEYKAQYLSDRIKDVTKLAVSEREGKIILLSGSRLYSIEIRH